MNWFHSMFKDSIDGSISSKRIITFLAFIICAISYLCDQFTHNAANKDLFDAMIYLVIAGLGFTVTEKFARKNDGNS